MVMMMMKMMITMMVEVIVVTGFDGSGASGFGL